MISYIRTMISCRWAARRLSQYLDGDPAAPLEPAELRRLEAHLATCERCSAVLADYTNLSRALAGWTENRAPDPGTVARMHDLLEQLTTEGR